MLSARGQNFRGTGNAAAFEPFRPETVTEFELGFKTDLLDRRLRVNLAAFHTDYKDVQRQVTFTNALLQQTSLFTNAAKAKIDGVELEIVAAPVPGLELMASGGYINARYIRFVDQTGDRTKEDWPAPDFVGTLGARYTFDAGVGALTLKADYNYRSKENLYPSTKFPNLVTQNAYGVLNARASLDVDAIDATISVYARNLTNKWYASAAIAIDNSGYASKIPGDPRLFGVEIVKRFGGS
jgi:iron complex outermembrane recepter protein